MFVFLLSLWCFELLLVSMLCCYHNMVFMCWTYIHPLCLFLYWLHIWMIIFFAKWSLKSFPYDCLIKLPIHFTSCLLYCNLLITLYLSFITCFTLKVYSVLCKCFMKQVFGSKFVIGFRFKCEWVFPLFPNSRVSLQSVIGCFGHGIAKLGDC